MNNTETAVEAFKALKIGFEKGVVQFTHTALFDDLSLHIDTPNGIPRFTYVLFDPLNPEIIVAQCVIVFADWVSETERKWQIGWCVDEKYRNKGLGFEVAYKALTQFSQIEQVQGDYIEATVDQDNVPSLKISEKLIGSEEILFNEDTGLNVHSYLKAIEKTLNVT